MGLFSKSALGIDVGVSSIKVVEVSLSGKKFKLENYLQFSLSQEEGSLKSFHTEEGLLLAEETATILEGVLKKAGIKEKRVAFALPDFSTFFTTFNLPPMSEQEAPRAIEFEARHHIPISLSDVNFDWQIIEKEEKKPAVKLKVLLVAVPKKVLFGYQKLAELCGFDVKGLEAEAFGLIRSVSFQNKSQNPVCLIDFGWKTTTISIIKERNLISSHSFDFSGSSLTEALANGLSISFQQAEEMKKKYGLDSKKEEVFKILSPKIDNMALEIENLCEDFFKEKSQKIDEVFISGGLAGLYGIKEYLFSKLNKNISISDPFVSLSYPGVLADRLKQLGPSFSVSVGVGMMGAES